MRNPRLLAVVALLCYAGFVSLVLGLPMGSSVSAQVKINAPPGFGPVVPLPADKIVGPQADNKKSAADDEDGFGDRVILPRDRMSERKVSRVREMITEEDWGNAVKVLQSLLDVKEDVFLQDEKGRWVSVRTEANRIIGHMPRDGQQFYEQQFGSEARKLLKRGLTESNPQAYADVALRYMHTEAGAEAAAHLGTYHLDHGRYIVAALCYERLLDREGTLEKLPALTLFKASIAFERAGDLKNRDRVWTQFVQRADNGERLPGHLRRMEMAQLKGLLALKESARPTRERFDWPIFLGSSDRAALAEGGAPFLAPRFSVSLLHKPRERESREFSTQAKEWIERALTRHTSRAQAQLSGFHPIAVGGKLIFRSYWGVHAHNIKTGELEWEAPTLMSLDYLAANRNRIDVSQQMTNWINTYLQHTPTILYDNTTLGTLSADNNRVYFVEDIAIPPHPSLTTVQPWRVGPQMGGELSRWMEHNKLSAYSLHTGKLAWEIGTDQPDQSFSGAFFLGPPLPLGGRLYVLAEMVGSGEIRLLCIESKKASLPGESELEKAELVWSQTLCLVDRRIIEDPARRTQAANLAYGDGVLVCPTNAGVLLGVDLLTRSLVWAHSYQEGSGDVANKGPKVQMGLGGYQQATISAASWASSAPIVKDGRVVFTAPDGESVRCLNLRDGTLVWREQRQNDLYLAGVFGEKVVLVGKELCRALHFKDGKEAWKTSTGLPAGRGVCNGQNYFLPLKSGEVWTISLAKGEVEGKSRAARQIEGVQRVLPGNLIFHEGDVLSQSATQVAVFPQLAVKENAITQLLQKNPNDPRGLTERGDLRLNRGELAGAVADLRAALSQKELPPEVQRTARERLYEALGDLLSKDFKTNEGQLEEYRALVQLPPQSNETAEAETRRKDEEQDRKARLFRIVAKGREEQGRMKEAVHAYLEFGKLGRKELLPIPEEQATRALPEVWIQGRISELLVKATPEQKRDLNDAFDAQWLAVKQAGDIESIEQFANLFGPICRQGQQARLLLAEKLIEANQAEQAQLKLWALARQAEPQLAAQALEALARLNTRLGELENAAYFYRLVAQRYPKVIIRDGKSGEELYLDLATDKRFLPYLEEPRRGWMLLGPGETLKAGRPEFNSSRENYGVQQQQYVLEPEGDVPPFFRRHRLTIDTNGNKFKLQDAVTGAERGGFALSAAGGRVIFSPNVQKARPYYRVAGGIVVFTWGPFIYGFDPLKPGKALWTQSLLGETDMSAVWASTGQLPQVMPNQQNGQMEILYPDGVKEALGGLGPVQPSQVVFLSAHEGLVAVDTIQSVEKPPDRARPVKRWVKSDVPAGAALFGDGESLFIVLPGRGDSPGRGITLRAIDGTPIDAPDFAALYHRRLKTVGRCLLLRDSEAKGATRLRLYDVQTGKDVWQRDASEQAIFLDTFAEDMAGFVEPSGELTIVNVLTGKDVLNAKLDPALLAKSPEIRLLRDAAHLFVAFNLPTDAAQPAGNRIAGYRDQLRSTQVNGPLFAFDRATGALRWQREVPVQSLIVEQFEEMPILLFASAQNQFNVPPGAAAGQPPLRRQVSPVLALDKRDGFDGRGGKAKGGNDAVYDEALNGPGQFGQLKVEPRLGLIELHTHQYRIVFRLTNETAQAEPGAAKESAAARSEAVPIPAPALPALPGQIRVQLQRQQLEQMQRVMQLQEEARRAADEARRAAEAARREVPNKK